MFLWLIDNYLKQLNLFKESDNGSEFNYLLEYFDATRILFQTSCVGTPQQNGRVERKLKHILNVGRALHFQAKLPIYFWGGCVLVASHLINCTPIPLLLNKTPFQILFFDKTPILMLFEPLGACVVRIIKKLREINSPVEVENVSLLDICSLKGFGDCLIWIQKNFLFHEM